MGKKIIDSTNAFMACIPTSAHLKRQPKQINKTMYYLHSKKA